MELSIQYGLQSKALYARLREVRAETVSGRVTDPTSVFLLRRRAAMLREMGRDTRDTADLLAHYYDGALSKRKEG